MWCLNLFLVIISIIYTTASPLYNETNSQDSCIITSYSQVSNIVKSCTNITIKDLDVPAKRTLQLDLQSGTTLTFQGTIYFGIESWIGPLVDITGHDITVIGAPGSVFNGNGKDYWYRNDDLFRKPRFFKITATGGSTFSNISLVNCPAQCVSIENSKQLTLSDWNIYLFAVYRIARNTIGFTILNSDEVTIKNSVITNQDDCVAVASGKNLHFTNLECSGGNGLALSVGMSEYDSSKNKVSNVTFSDCTVNNSINGIHIKTNPNTAQGSVNNITFSNIILSGITKYGINLEQDYSDGVSTGIPSNNIPIEWLKMRNIIGTMTGSRSMAVYVLCGSSGCFNFNWSDISISGASKNSSCTNYKPSGVSC